MIRAELLKLRRSPVWALAPILPLLAVLAGSVNYWMNREVLTGGWQSLLSQITLFYGMLFYSVGVALVVAAVWRPEHRSYSWNAALTSGRSRLALVLVKSLVVMLPVAAIQGCLLVFSFAAGLGMGLQGGLPAWFSESALLVVLVSAPLVLAQSLLSMLMRSFAGPVAFALVASVVGFLSLASPGTAALALSNALPHALATRAMHLGSSAVSDAGSLTIGAAAGILATAGALAMVLVALTALVVRFRTIEAR